MEYETVRATSIPNTVAHMLHALVAPLVVLSSSFIGRQSDKVRFSAPQAMENWRSILDNSIHIIVNYYLLFTTLVFTI